MATQHGLPGEWAKVKGTVFSLWPVFICFALVGAFATACVIGTSILLFGGLLLATVVLTLVLMRRGIGRVESYFKGARGEEQVAAHLALLPDAYHVFHDFEAGAFHVDHVVVGPTGVYSVETKNWRGHVTIQDGLLAVDGHLPSRSPLAQAAAEAKAVRARIKDAGDPAVTPVVCFASNTYSAVQDVVENVPVLNLKGLCDWVTSRPVVFAPDELTRLVQLMETSL